MTVAFSCTFARAVWLETQLHWESSWENIIGRKVEKSYMESCLDSQVMILKSLSLGRMILEISFKEKELERMISTKSTPSNNENIKAISPKYLSKLKHEAIIKLQEVFFLVHLMMGYIRGDSPLLFPNPSPPDSRFELEIPKLEFQAHNQLSHPLKGKKKLQEVYKSFRTGRKLADYPVLLGHCWKLLDFAELEWSSISFFNNEKHETAISRWSRAKTRAAKVGKGLSKNDKALELALWHWLEAIDPQHRYGHNLHLYYDEWLRSNSKEPFFYWLDFGEGKELNLNETCPRSKLQQQCIKYLSPMERIAYEVVLDDGKFLCKQTGELLHTTGDAKWIFVLSITKTLYVGEKKKGTFQHSSFLAGGATIAAGMLVVENGILKAVWPHSSHYRPKKENFKNFISFLRENNVDLTDVKITSSVGNQRYSSSEKELAQALNILGTEVINLKDLVQEETDSVEEAKVGLEHPKTKKFHVLSGNLTYLEIPKRDEMIGRLRLQNDGLAFGPICNDNSVDYLVEDVYRTSEEAFAPKQQIIDESCKKIEHIALEAILQKANAKKKSNSYQLGEQLSWKWKTGAGLQIGCVRDYPSVLQFSALEQVNLSPRSTSRSKSYISRCSRSGLSMKVFFSIAL